LAFLLNLSLISLFVMPISVAGLHLLSAGPNPELTIDCIISAENWWSA